MQAKDALKIPLHRGVIFWHQLPGFHLSQLCLWLQSEVKYTPTPYFLSLLHLFLHFPLQSLHPTPLNNNQLQAQQCRTVWPGACRFYIGRHTGVFVTTCGGCYKNNLPHLPIFLEDGSHGGGDWCQPTAGRLMKTIKQSRRSSGCFQENKVRKC